MICCSLRLCAWSQTVSRIIVTSDSVRRRLAEPVDLNFWRPASGNDTASLAALLGRPRTTPGWRRRSALSTTVSFAFSFIWRMLWAPLLLLLSPLAFSTTVAFAVELWRRSVVAFSTAFRLCRRRILCPRRIWNFVTRRHLRDRAPLALCCDGRFPRPAFDADNNI